MLLTIIKNEAMDKVHSKAIYYIMPCSANKSYMEILQLAIPGFFVFQQTFKQLEPERSFFNHLYLINSLNKGNTLSWNRILILRNLWFI